MPATPETKKPDVKSSMNLPSKRYDVSKMTTIQKLELLLADNRFYGMERKGAQWKMTVCSWNGISMRQISYASSFEAVIDWALKELNISQ